MKNNKLVVSIIEVAIAAFVYSSACAKQIYPAEILGRDLNYPGLGWAGTAPYYFVLIKNMSGI